MSQGAVIVIQAMDNCGPEERAAEAFLLRGRSLRSWRKRRIQDSIWENWSGNGVI